MKYPASVKREALRLFMLRTPQKEIIAETGVGASTLDLWRKDGHWVEARKDIESEAEEMVLRECRDVALVHKREVMVRDLEMANNLHEAIGMNLLTADGKVRKTVKARDLDLLAKAAKNSSDIATRIVGLNETSEKGSVQTINIGIVGTIPEAHAKDVQVHSSVG